MGRRPDRPRPARGRPPRTRARRPGSARGSAPPAPRSAEVEQVVDDLREPVGLAHDAIGELLQHADVVGRGHRLGEQAERADRRLQLVTHVGDEVAAHALDASRLRDVAGERDRADDLARGDSGNERELEHLARRAVELQLALGDLAGERLVQQLARPRPRRAPRRGARRRSAARPRCARPRGRCGRRRRSRRSPRRARRATSAAPLRPAATRSAASCFACSTAVVSAVPSGTRSARRAVRSS